MKTVFYSRGMNQEVTQGQVQDFRTSLGSSTLKAKKSGHRKVVKTFNVSLRQTTQESGEDTKVANQEDVQEQEQSQTDVTPEGGSLKIQRTVFDLGTFDDVLLLKFVPSPARPKTIQEALALVEGKTERLMELIYDGLVADLRKAEYLKIEGFKLPNEDTKDGSGGSDYTGSFADDTKKDLINAAVLNFAKILGYDKDLSPEKKKAIREQARDLIRKNPEMVKSIQESK